MPTDSLAVAEAWKAATAAGRNQEIHTWLVVGIAFLQAVSTGILGLLTYRVQKEQVEARRQQVAIQRQQIKMLLTDKRERIYGITQAWIARAASEGLLAGHEAFGLLRDTAAADIYFGEEVDKYLSELHRKGGRLIEAEAELLKNPSDVSLQERKAELQAALFKEHGRARTLFAKQMKLETESLQ